MGGDLYLGGVKQDAWYWKTQLPVDYIDTSLTINTWETVSSDLSGGKPAKLWYIMIEQTNNGATAEDIELEITLNGTAYTWDPACDSGTIYYGVIIQSLTTSDFTTYEVSTSSINVAALDADHAIPFIAKSVGLIRTRQTSDVDGTSAQIEINIVWEKLVNIVE